MVNIEQAGSESEAKAEESVCWVRTRFVLGADQSISGKKQESDAVMQWSRAAPLSVKLI